MELEKNITSHLDFYRSKATDAEVKLINFQASGYPIDQKRKLASELDVTTATINNYIYSYNNEFYIGLLHEIISIRSDIILLKKYNKEPLYSDNSLVIVSSKLVLEKLRLYFSQHIEKGMINDQTLITYIATCIKPINDKYDNQVFNDYFNYLRFLPVDK